MRNIFLLVLISASVCVFMLQEKLNAEEKTKPIAEVKKTENAENKPPLPIHVVISGIPPVFSIVLKDVDLNKEINETFILITEEPNQKITFKTIGLPKDAKLTINEPKGQEQRTGTFKWTPTLKGEYGIGVFLKGDKNSLGSFALFYKVK